MTDKLTAGCAYVYYYFFIAINLEWSQVVFVKVDVTDTTVVYRPQASNRRDRRVSSVSNHRHDRRS